MHCNRAIQNRQLSRLTSEKQLLPERNLMLAEITFMYEYIGQEMEAIAVDVSELIISMKF